MPEPSRSLLLSILFVAALLAGGFFALTLAGNTTGAYHLRNALPALLGWCLLAYLLSRHSSDARWWLGWAGFCVPAIGLSAYLHLAFIYDWQQIASNALTPALLFRFLPLYAFIAGAIGFAIGWIIGRGVVEGQRIDR